MSSPVTPGGQPPLPPLQNLNKVTEIFANQLVGISVIDGNVHLTMSVIRPCHNTNNPADNENVITIRNVITLSAWNAMLSASGQLFRAIQLQQSAMTIPN